MYDGEEFSVIDVIILLGGSEGLREVCTWMEVSVRVFLHQYAAGGSERGISHDEEGLGVIGKGQNRLL